MQKIPAEDMNNKILESAAITIKDVHTKIFQSIDFFKFLLQSDNELLVSEMKKKLGVAVFVSEIKTVENCPHFEKSVHVI